MKITWQVDDGYINNGPHQTYIDDEVLSVCCDTHEEREELIREIIQEDFDQKISWSEVRRDL